MRRYLGRSGQQQTSDGSGPSDGGSPKPPDVWLNDLASWRRDGVDPTVNDARFEQDLRAGWTEKTRDGPERLSLRLDQALPLCRRVPPSGAPGLFLVLASVVRQHLWSRVALHRKTE